MKLRTKKIISLLSLLFVFSFFLTGIGQANPEGIGSVEIPNTGLPNPTEGANGPIVAVLTYFLDWILTIFVVLAVLGFVGSGVMYVTSGGGEQKETAKKWLTFSIIGVFVGLASLIIVKTIQQILSAS